MATYANWETQVLQAIGAPLTAANAQFLDTWQRYEGGTAANNPLNTTQAYGGASNYNSVGVKNYPSSYAGTVATAQTLQNGRYPGLLAALRSGNPTGYINSSSSAAARVVQDLRTWGTGNFATQVQMQALRGLYTNPPLSPYDNPRVTIDPKTGKTTTEQPPKFGGALGAGQTGFDFLSNLLTAQNLLRAGQVLAGSVLVLLGVYLLARQIGLGAVASSAKGILPDQASRQAEASQASLKRAYDAGQVDATADVRRSERAAREKRRQDFQAGEVPF